MVVVVVVVCHLLVKQSLRLLLYKLQSLFSVFELTYCLYENHRLIKIIHGTVTFVGEHILLKRI